MNDFSTFEQQLLKHGKIIYTNVGDSMMPFIKEGRDVLVIEATDGRLQKYDVPLYKRQSGQYVLHRIHRVTDKGYVTCGDNRAARERYVLPEEVIGVLTGVIRAGKEIGRDSLTFKLYAHLGCDTYFIRFIVGKIRALFRRLFSGKHRA